MTQVFGMREGLHEWTCSYAVSWHKTGESDVSPQQNKVDRRVLRGFRYPCYSLSLKARQAVPCLRVMVGHNVQAEENISGGSTPTVKMEIEIESQEVKWGRRIGQIVAKKSNRNLAYLIGLKLHLDEAPATLGFFSLWSIQCPAILQPGENNERNSRAHIENLQRGLFVHVHSIGRRPRDPRRTPSQI